MSKSVSKWLVILLVALGASAAAAAQSAAPSAAAGTQASASVASATDQKAVPAPGDRNCIRDTGSLIRPKPGHCLPVPGRSYTQEEIRNTGETRIGPALEKLDPSITVRGGH